MKNSENSAFATGLLFFACILNAYLLFGLKVKEQQTESGHLPNNAAAEEAREEMDHEPYYIDLD